MGGRRDPSKLTIKERAFVSAIATPTSPTFGNGTQSIVSAGYRSTPPSAANLASELVRKPHVQTAIDELLHKHGVGIEERIAVTKGILSHRYSYVDQLSGKGKLKGRTRISNAKHQLQAIHMLNKLDGSYARAEAIGHAQGKVLDPLIAEWTRRLRAELRQGGDGAPDSPPEAGSGARGEVVDIPVVVAPEAGQGQPGETTQSADAITVIQEVPSTTGGGGMPTGVESNE